MGSGSSRIEAGYGQARMVFAPGLGLWGYMDREGPAEGVRDPLFVKGIAFRGANGATAAWLVCDLGRPPMPADAERIRNDARALGVHEVVFHATHTHHAPAVEQLDETGSQPIRAACLDALAQAVERLQPVRFEGGACAIDIAHNRRVVSPDGRCRMFWRNPGRLPTEPLDQEARIIRVCSDSGTPIALLVHYACHPVVLGPSNRAYSGDWPAVMTERLEAETGAPAVFLQGACGDINPYLDKTPLDAGGEEAVTQTGREAAEAVLAALDTLEPMPPGPGRVAVRQISVEVGLRWNLDDPAVREAVVQSHGALFEYYVARATPDLTVPLTVALVDDTIAMLGIPGECFVQFQLALKSELPVPIPLVCGYVNGYEAYFPPIRDAAAGGYGGTVAAYVGIGAAETLYTRGVTALQRLMGRLSDSPSAQAFEIAETTDPRTPF